jgi:hypothetical protein
MTQQDDYFRRTVLDPETNRQKTISIPVLLGLKSEMTKSHAREKLESGIVRLTGQTLEDGTVKNGTITFGWFAFNRYRAEFIAGRRWLFKGGQNLFIMQQGALNKLTYNFDHADCLFSRV